MKAIGVKRPTSYTRFALLDEPKFSRRCSLRSSRSLSSRISCRNIAWSQWRSTRTTCTCALRSSLVIVFWRGRRGARLNIPETVRLSGALLPKPKKHSKPFPARMIRVISLHFPPSDLNQNLLAAGCGDGMSAWKSADPISFM